MLLAEQHLPRRDIQHPGRGRLHAVELLPRPVQGEEIEQHLHAQAVHHIRERKALAPGLVVHDAQVEPAAVQPAVHPVRYAAQAHAAAARQLRRGREARAGEIQLEAQGTEVGVLQLLRHIAHDAAHALGKAGVEIGKARAPAFEAAQLLFQVAPGVFVCQGVEPLRRGGGKAALRSRILRDVLEDIVDERARFRGAELRRTARSRAQAITKEVGEAAGGQLFHPRGRKAQLLPVERAGRAL